MDLEKQNIQLRKERVDLIDYIERIKIKNDAAIKSLNEINLHMSFIDIKAIISVVNNSLYISNGGEINNK